MTAFLTKLVVHDKSNIWRHNYIGIDKWSDKQGDTEGGMLAKNSSRRECQQMMEEIESDKR